MGANGSLFGSSWSDLTDWLRGKPKEEDRRSENRLPVHEQAILTWRAEAGSEESAAANLIDISTLGFKVRCPHNMEIGMHVTLTDSNGKTAEGSIVHCERDEDGYLVGAQAEWETPEAKSEATRRLAAQQGR
jgi:hypothetical protein